jgi:hypothetical protein
MSKFIGRGELRAEEILLQIFSNYSIETQVPIKRLIDVDTWNQLGKGHSQHKCDIVVSSPYTCMVIEVNYKHGKIANDKWKVYKSALEKTGCKCVTIDDNECISLFEMNGKFHTDTWQDWIDVINSLEKAGVKVK